MCWGVGVWGSAGMKKCVGVWGEVRRDVKRGVGEEYGGRCR